MVRIEILRNLVQRPARLLPLPARCFIQHLISDRCLTLNQRRGRHSSCQSTKIKRRGRWSQHDCCSHKLGIVMNKRNKQASRQANFGHARVRKFHGTASNRDASNQSQHLLRHRRRISLSHHLLHYRIRPNPVLARQECSCHGFICTRLPFRHPNAVVH